jgi:hypothetical protein
MLIYLFGFKLKLGNHNVMLEQFSDIQSCSSEMIEEVKIVKWLVVST